MTKADKGSSLVTAVTNHLSHGPKNPPILSMKYWLVNRDPYNGLLYSLYNWVVFHPLYTLNNVSDGCGRAQRLCHMHFTWEFTIRNGFLFIIDQWIFHIFVGYLCFDCLKKHE